VLDEDPALVPKPRCPYCGSTARLIHRPLEGHVRVTGSITLERVRDGLKHDVGWLLVVVLLALGGTAVSTWLLSGFPSFMVSLALEALGFVFGALAATRVIERERFGPFT
jgi:hypothetical protein